MRRRKRWLVIYFDVYGVPRVVREIDDYEYAKRFAEHLRHTVRTARMIPNPDRVVELLLDGWDHPSAGELQAKLWQSVLHGGDG